MKFNQKLILGLSSACVILSLLVDTNHTSNLNTSSNSVQSVLKLNGGDKNRSSQSTSKIYLSQAPEQNISKREMLRKHFPDWEERINYQKKQKKIYRSGIARIAEAKRCGVKIKLTKQEQDAFDYFYGQNDYKYYQSIETPPNRFDTRWSFLLKVEKNKNMRENFLKSYNRRKSEN